MSAALYSVRSVHGEPMHPLCSSDLTAVPCASSHNEKGRTIPSCPSWFHGGGGWI